MINRTMMYAIIGISLFAVSGIAYAAFTSSIYINGNASAGTMTLQWNGSGFTNGAGTYSTCDWSSNTGTSVTLTVSNLSPGDSCTAYAYVTDTGSLPATSASSSLSSPTNVCNYIGATNCFYVYDSMGLNSETGSSGSASGNPLIAPSGNYGYSITVALPSGSTIQSLSGSFTITITGSVGS